MRSSVVRLSTWKDIQNKGWMERLRYRLTTQKFFRPDDEESPTMKPSGEKAFRYPAPAGQPEAEVPQGDYEKVFNISYYDRDNRRMHAKSTVAPLEEIIEGDLPPTPGTPEPFVASKEMP